MKVPFSKVVCDGRELELVSEVLDSGWLTTASKAKEFEERFAAKVNAKYACAVNSCTAALHLALESLGVQAGDKVFVPAFTFTATAEVIRYLGADPVVLDIDPETCLLTPSILEDAIHQYPDAKVLMAVHYGGQAMQMFSQNSEAGILDICKAHGIKILEDAAHAFPAKCEDRMIGSIGDITCFSFYANKTITTGEGGMITTDDEELYRRCKVMRLHGIDRDVWNRFTSDKPSWEYDVVAPGYKYNMPDVNAAIGLAQLERADELRNGRERCARFYMDHLSSVKGLDLPVCKVPLSSHAWHLFHVVLNSDAPVSRNRMIESLSERGIGTSVHYKPIYRLKYYRETYDLSPKNYPNGERVWSGCLSLPIYPSLSNEELRYVCDCIEEILS